MARPRSRTRSVPAGLHYDYDVQSTVAALYGQVEKRFLERFHVLAGLRAEYVGYDYDNRMLAGNTDENGVPCPDPGCLYTRPADRKDDFFNAAPKLSLSYDLATGAMIYASVSRGFRPPEITELYRLQRGQGRRGPRFRAARCGRARHQDVVREVARIVVGVRHGQEGRDPARLERLQRQQRTDVAPGDRIRALVGAARRAAARRGRHVCASSLRVLTRGRRR
jgi:outer membrane receptor for Fe3+-dicitrate